MQFLYEEFTKFVCKFQNMYSKFYSTGCVCTYEELGLFANAYAMLIRTQIIKMRCDSSDD